MAPHRCAGRLVSRWLEEEKVFPDFLVALEETKGKPSKLVVVETKGLHLKNEDTDYKRKLFETLERMRVALWGWF